MIRQRGERVEKDPAAVGGVGGRGVPDGRCHDAPFWALATVSEFFTCQMNQADIDKITHCNNSII